MSNPNVFTVKELTRKIKRSIEESPELRDVWVRAEISNFTHHSRGHMYLTLKDEESRIRAVMFAGHNRYLKFVPKNGLKVIAHGQVNVYERDGQYQLYIKQMQPDGIGALFQAYEDLKKKLQLKGWFAENIKKPIPAIPRKIGLITSPTGAAVRDILTTIERRFPIADVLLFPVLVQGDQAPASLRQAIEAAHQEGGIDVLIVGRGGGSIEELWAFNEEQVAQAIYSSSIPIISAVGHETDFTIADLVADLRAPTPTAAAELAVPVLTELNQSLGQYNDRLSKALNRLLRVKREHLERLRHSYAFKYLNQLVGQKEQELDTSFLRLQKGMQRMIEKHKQNRDQLNKRLHRLNLSSIIVQSKAELERLLAQLIREMRLQLQGNKTDLSYFVAKLDASSPLKIMNKGYSLVYDHEKRDLYKSVRQIDPGQAIRVVMKDGELDCQVWGIKEENQNE